VLGGQGGNGGAGSGPVFSASPVGGDGGAGGAGGSAQGGGFVSLGTNVSLFLDQISQNSAVAGAGANGGLGASVSSFFGSTAQGGKAVLAATAATLRVVASLLQPKT
jgi:hypothetical protein